MNDPRQLTRNFHVSELMCRDGTPVPDEYLDNARRICERAQELRDVVGPLVVTSGYRTPGYNSSPRVRGAKNSQHLYAAALDLRSATYEADQLHSIYLSLIRKGQVPDGGLGLYLPNPAKRRTHGWIHIDIWRPRRWRG